MAISKASRLAGQTLAATEHRDRRRSAHSNGSAVLESSSQLDRSGEATGGWLYSHRNAGFEGDLEFAKGVWFSHSP